MRAHGWFVVVLFAAGMLAACGGEEASSEGPAGARVVAPTRDALVQTLRDLLAALQAGDYEQASTYLVPLPGMEPEEVPEILASFLERGEISADGIEILAKEGEFGELDELFPERGKSWAGRLGVDHDHCWALTFDDAEVAALWDGSVFRLIRLDDVGKQK